MPEQTITCPKCGQKIELTEAFTHEIEEKLRATFQSEIKRKEAEHQQAIEAAKKEYRDAYTKEVEKIKAQAQQQAKDSLDVEIKDLKLQLQAKAKQLEESQKQELELRKRQRELEEREQNLTLEVQRTLDKERTKIWEDASKRAADEQQMKMLEKEKQISDMHKQVEEMRRKIELTSQQAQGEVQELELESILSAAFRFDTIAPVAKGVRGADVMQEVRDENGTICGNIIWESKRTKAWSDGWILKLKDDQRAAKAELAVIVTTALPPEIKTIGLVQGVWVANFASAIGLATALRANLIQLAYARYSLAGKNDKMELMYNYLSGPEFKQRVEAIVESFTSMKNDLESEKRAMEKIWAKRDKQIERVIQSTAGMYGDLQGIIGKSLPEIEALEFPEDKLLL
ncbi:MAG: DUF2130 domain-containing protein [Bacteroidetes bacterium]|nr:MAG: DUF2130 domain-containing protein [Bacteroidota bacterium]